MQQELLIDGSLNEGGGQMLRSSLALSVLLGRQFRISNIRSNRPNPGINNQLLNQINLISHIVKSEVEGVQLGSQEVRFNPLEKFNPQNLTCQAQTAQSITLILQSLLPISLNTIKPVILTIHGGTYLNHSPTINAWQEIFLPFLKQVGIDCQIEVIKEGYFPQGGGLVKATINPIIKLNSIEITKIQKINRLTCTYLLPQPSGVIQFDNQFVNGLKGFAENQQLEIKSNVKIVNSKKFKKCYGITLFSHSNINSYDHTIINEGDRQIQETVDDVIKLAQKQLKQQTCLDEHHQDQLILFMALAEGKSEILIGEPTLHTKSLIYVINQFLPDCKIEIQKLEEQYLLKVQGVNYKF